MYEPIALAHTWGSYIPQLPNGRARLRYMDKQITPKSSLAQYLPS